jgi:hypothetical protein
VQAEYGVEPIEQPPQLEHVLSIGSVDVDAVHEPPESADLMGDLDVFSLHRRHRFLTAESPGDDRIETLILGPFMGQQLVDEDPMQVVGGQQGAPEIVAAECIADGSDPLEVRP